MIKLSLCLINHHTIKTYCGVEVCLHSFLTSALDGSEWSPSCLGRFISDTHWVGPRACLDAVAKIKRFLPPVGNYIGKRSRNASFS
jgi:hypothetical protein